MSGPSDTPNEEPERDGQDDELGDAQGRPDLDYDAEFERLVAGFGPTPAFEDRPRERPAEQPDGDERLRRLFRPVQPPGDEVAPDADAVAPDDHFVPPPAPPLPRPEPRRLAAWTALFGAPIAGLVLLVLSVAVPSIVQIGLFVAFVWGFVFLVATMNSGGHRDGWDDGARL